MPVYLKLEHRQTTGSFKLRGASNAIAQLDDAEKQARRRRGLDRQSRPGARLCGKARRHARGRSACRGWCRRTRSTKSAGSAPRSASSATARTMRSKRSIGWSRRGAGHAAAFRPSRHHRRARDARAGDHRAGPGRRDGAGAAVGRRAGGRRCGRRQGHASPATRVIGVSMDARRGDEGQPRCRQAGAGRGTADAGGFARRRHRPRQPVDFRDVPRPARRRHPALRGRDRRRHPPCL